MLNFTREQRAEAYDKLPQDLRKVIMSNTLSETFQKIAREYRLNIDRMGALGHVVTLTILNLIPREQMIAKISEELQISSRDAELIGKSVNERVFLRIREILQEEQTREEKEMEQEATDRDTENTETAESKEEILAEIEKPGPQPQNAQQNIAAAHEFIGGKLSETSNIPAQKVNIELKKPAEKPKTYSNDPYREPTV